MVSAESKPDTYGNRVLPNTADAGPLKASNLLIQIRVVKALAAQSNFEARFSPDLLKQLHQLAMNGLYSCAGHFRNHQVYVGKKASSLAQMARTPAKYRPPKSTSVH